MPNVSDRRSSAFRGGMLILLLGLLVPSASAQFGPTPTYRPPNIPTYRPPSIPTPTYTPPTYQPPEFKIVKKCTSCQRVLPDSTPLGSPCPYCNPSGRQSSIRIPRNPFPSASRSSSSSRRSSPASLFAGSGSSSDSPSTTFYIAVITSVVLGVVGVSTGIGAIVVASKRRQPGVITQPTYGVQRGTHF